MDRVSVVIATYNSEKTILAALDSILAQTYQDIELIVQDDHSTDKTVSLAEAWGMKNSATKRFSKFLVNKNETNIGTAKNFDIGCSQASGKWIKILGGDDILIEDCIEKNVNYAHSLNEDALITSDMIYFYEDDHGEFIEFPNSDKKDKDKRWINTTDSKKQYKRLLKSFGLNAPTLFFSSSGLREIGGFDDRYDILEDWPLALKWTRSGKCIRYMEENTVLYRRGARGTEKGDSFYNIRLVPCIEGLKRDEIYPRISKFEILYWINEGVNHFRKLIVIKLFDNKVTNKSLFIHYVIGWLSPYRWPQKIHALKSAKVFGLLKKAKWMLRESE